MMNQQKQQHGISAIFVLVMLMFMMIIGLTFLMVANLGRKNSASVGRKHAFESGESATDRIINRLKYDMIGNNAIMGDVTFILRNPSGKGNMEALNEYSSTYSGIQYINVADRGNQYPEIMSPASDEPYDYPYSNRDRTTALANRAGMGMEDDPWLSTARPTPVDNNNDGVADYWRWDHVADLRHVSLNPRTRIFLGYYQADLLDADGDSKTYNDKVPTGTTDANGIALYELLPRDHDRSQRVWTQANGAAQYYLIDSGNTLDEFNPDRAPFLVNVRANSNVAERQSRDFSEHVIVDSRLDGYYDTSSGDRIADLWSGDTPIAVSAMTADQLDEWRSNRDGIPDHEAFLPDADGDGIGDSRWMWAPLAQARDVRYVMAVRVVDLSSMVNINTAGSMRGSASPYNYNATLNYTNVGVDSSLLIHRLNTALYAQPTTIYSAMLSKRPSGAGDQQTNYNNYVQIYNGTTTFAGYDTLDELYLRHGGTTSSFLDPTTLITAVAAAPFQVYADDSLSDTYERIKSTVASYNSVSWNQLLTDMMNLNRNPKEALTTISGAIDIAPTVTVKDTTQNLAVVQDAGGEIVDNMRLRKDLNRIINTMVGGTAQARKYNIARALQYELKSVWNHAENGALTPYWLRATLGGTVGDNRQYDNVDAWTMRMALAMKDYFDSDGVISYHDKTYGTTYMGASGFEKMPFIAEVMIMKPYQISSVTKNSEQDYDVDVTWLDEVGLIVELRNPFTSDLNLSNAKLFIGSVELISDLSVTTGGAALSPDENVVIYINTEVPDMTSSTDFVADKPMLNENTLPGDPVVPDTTDDMVPRAQSATYRFDASAAEAQISNALKDNNVEVYVSGRAEEIETGAVQYLKYQSVLLTDNVDFTFPENGGELSNINLSLPGRNIGDPEPTAGNASHRLFRRFNFLGNANGWKMVMLQGVQGSSDSPRWRREMNNTATNDRSPHFAGTLSDNRFSADHKYIDTTGMANSSNDINEFFEGNSVVPHDRDQILYSDHKDISNTNTRAFRRMSEVLYVNLLGPGVSADATHPKAINEIIEAQVEYWKDEVSPAHFRFDLTGDRYIRINSNNDNLETMLRTMQSRNRMDETDSDYDTEQERAEYVQNNQLSYMQIPPIHMFLSRFSTDSPYRDLLDYSYIANSDGLYDGSTLTDNSGTNALSSNLIRHGAININTVDAQTLMHVLPGMYGFNEARTKKIVDAIIKYRDNPQIDTNADGTPDTHYRVAAIDKGGLGLPATWRGGRYGPVDVNDPPEMLGGRPGIAHLSELAVVFERLTDSGGTDKIHLDDELDSYDVTKLLTNADYLNRANGSDYIKDDFVERQALYGFMSEMFVTRSDYYAVYVLLRGYAFDPSKGFNTLGELLEQKRHIYIVDRSTLMTGDSSISIRANILE